MANVVPVVVNALSPHVERVIRMGFQWAAPRAAAATQLAIEKGYEAREVVRRLAEANFEALTEEQILELDGNKDGTGTTSATSRAAVVASKELDLIDLASDDEVKSTVRTNDSEQRRSPSPIMLHCQTIRASRNVLETEAFGGPIPLLAHWSVEVDGVFFELRTNPQDGTVAPGNKDRRIILHQEVGDQVRNIKLEITTKRNIHKSTKSYKVGTTVLNEDRIIRIAALIFRRFGQSYDPLVDNCQLFSQLLAEAIGGKENIERVREVFEKKSIMKVPIAGSWVAAPAYHLIATLHHAYETPDASAHECDESKFCVACIVDDGGRRLDKLLEDMEKFHYHPRIYRSRQQTLQAFDIFIDSLNPFK